jgi:hypothetical protein
MPWPQTSKELGLILAVLAALAASVFLCGGCAETFDKMTGWKP